MKVTVDAAVFSYVNESLNVLLIKRKFQPFLGKYALAGGFVNDDESADAAVLRKLKEETNVKLDYLEQLYTFTSPKRDPRERVISITYYGLIDPRKHDLITNVHASAIAWFSYADVMKMDLAFDHKEILKYAHTRLANKVKYEPIGFELLPKEFTMTDIYKLYSVLADHELDRRNFSKKILKTGLLIEGDKKEKTVGAGRKATLYSFDEKKYKELKKNGFNFDI
ncbi:MAG: NUDIX hydrolase [Richelia sp. RM2_1_2]|nr:NUDIX hydrolase [Richelia sp. RM2_1_2]